MKVSRVALLRSWYLNPWEMKRYEPLKEQFEITAIGTHHPLFDVSGINLDINKLHWPGELFYLLGEGTGQLINRGLYKYFRYNQWMFGLERVLRDFDIIHAVDTHHLFSLQAARAKRRYNSKLVLTVWENIPFQDERRNVFRKISREVIENTDIFLPVTNRSKEMLLVEGVPEEKIVVIPQPVDLQKFKPLGKNKDMLVKYGCREGQPVILFIGRLHKTKGVEFLLYALKRLLQDKAVKSLSPKLLLVGTGERRSDIEGLIKKLGIADNVVLCGGVPHQELVNYYACADMFVLPSIPVDEWQEQFGMVLVEAMACGKPTISTQSGSIPDVVGDAGILVQPADFYSLYQAMKQLILSPRLSDDLAARAKKRAETEFNPFRIVEETARVYRTLVGR